MHKCHVVLLGTKSNSWAWGVERAIQIAKLNRPVCLIDFSPRDQRNPRNLFLLNSMKDFDISRVHWMDIIDGEELKRIQSDAKNWVLSLNKIENWVESKWGELPLGRILMSNYARMAGTRDFDLKLIPKNLQLKIASQSLIADRVFEKIRLNYDEISIANGRSPIEATFLFRARATKKRTHVMEMGATTRQSFVYRTSPHYSPDWWEMLNLTLDKYSSNELDRVSAQYWEKRLTGWDELSGRDWSTHFKSGHVPVEINKGAILFFCTSQHEVPVLKEFECTDLGFSSQQSAVETLVKACQELNLQLVIKRHPNSVASDGIDRESLEWEWVKKHAGVIYLEPQSGVDTYSLLKIASAVITYKSSVGVEASALGVPARAMGPAEWAFNDECRVWSLESLMDFIKMPTLLTSDVYRAWGYLAKTFGQPLELFSDITGGYAITKTGEKIFSAEYYETGLRSNYNRIKNRLWSIRTRILKK